jgi:hypothetical protein
MEVVAFWIALAAVLIAGALTKSRSESEKHETLRRLIDKNGAVDEAQIRAVLNGSRPSAQLPWMRPRVQGDSYRGMRAVGTIAMCVAIGMIAFFTWLWRFGGEEDAVVGVGFGVVILAFGIGLFLASRYMERPARDAGAHAVE